MNPITSMIDSPPGSSTSRGITLIYSGLPPALDGIGDYTALLATELAKHGDISVLTSSSAPVDPLPGVRVMPCFDPDRPRTDWNLLQAIREVKPEWVVLQYNPFGFGQRGLNLVLPKVMRSIRSVSRVAVMFHERYFGPVENARTALMAGWTRWQFRQLVRTAEVCFYSTDPWVEDHRRRFPSVPAMHLPVGSNIPLGSDHRLEVRRELGIDPTRLVLGLFGTAHVSRKLDWVAKAFQSVKEHGVPATLLYIGPDREAVISQVGRDSVICVGALPGAGVSRCLRAADVFLSPFADGVSTRRGSFITALQHGLATVGTIGPSTGALLAADNGKSFILTNTSDPQAFAGQAVRLATDAKLRDALALRAVEFHERHFAWPSIAEMMLGRLKSMQPLRL